jgi:hypothetical protein
MSTQNNAASEVMTRSAATTERNQAMAKKLPQRRRPRNYDGFESIKTIMRRDLALLNILQRQAERAVDRPFTSAASKQLDRIHHAREAFLELIQGELATTHGMRSDND